MTLTTDELRRIVETDHVQCGDAAAMARELLANREAQSVAYNQVQRDMMKDILVRKLGGNLLGEKLGMDDIHAATMELIKSGFRLYTAPPAPAVPDVIITAPIEAMRCGPAASYVLGWNACRAAMLAQPVSGGYTLPEGFKLMPLEMTDEIGEAIAMEARCCGGIALCIYEAALAAAPEGGNDHDT